MFNFSAASPHFYSVCSVQSQGAARGPQRKSAEASDGLKPHASFLSAGYPVDGSLGREGADLLSAPRRAPDSESRQAPRNKT